MTVICIIKRKFKQWLSTIPPIWTKRTIISHLNSISTKKTYDIGNPGHGMCQAQNSDVEVINVIPILPVWLLDFERQCIYKLVRDSSAVRWHYYFLLEPWDVRELYIRKTARLASPTLGRHISTFRGYRILFSIRNPYINRFTNHFSIHS